MHPGRAVSDVRKADAPFMPWQSIWLLLWTAVDNARPHQVQQGLPSRTSDMAAGDGVHHRFRLFTRHALLFS